jgi:phage gp45-like
MIARRTPKDKPLVRKSSHKTHGRKARSKRRAAEGRAARTRQRQRSRGIDERLVHRVAKAALGKLLHQASAQRRARHARRLVHRAHDHPRHRRGAGERAGQAQGEVFDSEHWSHFGFDSRPHPQDETGRCEVIFSRSDDVTICTKDRRYKVSLKDGEVAIYTGKNGAITCKQVFKPDGTIVMQGTNLGIMVTKDDKGKAGDVVISAENTLTLARTEGTASMIMIKEDGGIQVVTSGGSNLTLESNGKAVLGVDQASIVLDGKKAIINAAEISIVGSAVVGILPTYMPVATVGCMAGPFPILNGSMELKAQYP